MFASSPVVDFIVPVAWLQQLFLNRLIAADMDYLKANRPQSDSHASESSSR